MDMCANPKCGKRLIIVDPDWPYHPTPQCDPRTEWAMPAEELAVPASQEANPT